MKTLRRSVTIFVTLLLIFVYSVPAFGRASMRVSPPAGRAPDPHEMLNNSGEESVTTEHDSRIASQDVLLFAETKIDKNRLEFLTLSMPQLENRERRIVVYLPSDYQGGDKRYPVNYVLAAQDLFMPSGFSPDDRSLAENLFQFYTQAQDRETILVGIESDPIHVWDEYSPWVNRNMYLWKDPYDANEEEGGEGEAFLDFLVSTLKPLIDTKYRTLSDRVDTSISGSRMGGLLAVYAGLTKPEIYSKVIAMSPDIWFAERGGAWLSDNHLLKLIDQQGVTDSVSFYLDVDLADRVTDLMVKPAVLDAQGTKLSFPRAYLEGTQALVNMLYQKGGSISSAGDGIIVPAESKNTTSMVLGEGDVFLNYLPIIMKPAIPPVITSTSWTLFTVSAQNSFTITTTGEPTPSISIAGEIPAGVSFVENGDGTATISGTPSTARTYVLTITASNGFTPDATQTFMLGVVEGCSKVGSCLLTFSMDMGFPLNRVRNISVYLPPNYKSGTYYPVIYLMTAQYMFGAQIGAFVEDKDDWKIDETLDAYYNNTGRGIIAVGIWHNFDSPWSEYTLTMNLNMDHWVWGLPPLDNPEGGAMINFIKEKLKPQIDASFHTLTDRDHTAIGGGSRAGLLALYAGLTAPETFSKVMAMSPAVWVTEGGSRDYDFSKLPKWYAANGLQAWFNTNQAPANVQYYLYIGTYEQTGYERPYVVDAEGYQITIQAAYLDGAVRTRDNLIYREGVKSIWYIENSGGTHLASVWRTYVNSVLTWFGY